MNFLDNHNQERNKTPDASLQEVEARLLRAQNTSIPDSTFFQNKLKAQILEKRRSNQASMNPFLAFLKKHRPSRQRTFGAALALVVIVALITSYFSSSGGSLFVSPVYAQDNFEVTPTSGDAIAVESNTHFLVKSKAAIDTNDLKKSLKLSPDVNFKIEKKSDHEFEVIPEKSLKEREVYNLKIDYSYRNEQQVTVERDYSFAFQVKNQLKVVKTLPGKDTSNVPVNSGIEVTFSSENISGFEQAFSIQPAVQGKFEKHNRTWVFVPSDLAPKQMYTVTINKNIKIEGANPMTEDYTFQFETAQKIDPSISNVNTDSWRIYDTYSFFEFGSKQTVVMPIWTRDGSQGDFAVRAFAFPSQKEFYDVAKQKDSIPSWALFTRAKENVNTAQLQKVADYKLQPQQYSYNKYLVLPGNMAPGYYVLEVEKDGETSQILVVISNLATFIEVTDTKTLVWVNNLITQKPQPGAVVQDMQTGLSGTTNANGVVTFETSQLFPEKTDQTSVAPHYMQVKSGNESIFLRFYNSKSYYYYDNRGSVTDKNWKYISLDRGVYKTTDDIKFWGFVQPRTGTENNAEISVSLLPPSGWNWYAETDDDAALLQQSVKANESGVFEGDMKLNNLTPGYYTLVFKKGDQVLENRYVEIQSYIKPAYALSTVSSKNAVYADEPVLFTTKAAFFEGTPVSKLNLDYEGTENGTLSTNDQGEATAKVTSHYVPCTLETGCDRNYSLSYTVKPSQAEEGEVSNYQYAQVFYSHVNTALEIKELSPTTAQVSSTVYLRDLSYLNNDDYRDDYLSVKDVASNKKVKGLIKEISYNKQETGEYYDFINKKKVKTYTYNRVEKNFLSFDGVTDNNGHYNFDFALDPEKSYTVALLVDDGFGFQDYILSYYYTRKGYETNQGSNYTWYSLRLPENKFSFSLGEQVVLQTYQNEKKLESPTGPILYYTLKDGLQKYDVTNSSSYAFTFDQQAIPNIYVGAIYFDGKTYNSVTQDGLLSVMFNSEDRRLGVDIQADKTEYGPGQQATLSIATTDKSGSGHPATINVSVIDEAYFAVGSSGAGDPLFGLYSPVDIGEKYNYVTHGYSRLDRFGGAEKGCFLPGTKITMADGSLKNIEDVQVGDEVQTFKDAISPEIVHGKVSKLQNHLVSEYLVINDHLRVTPEHRMLINGLWRMAGTAKVGDMLRDENNKALPITSIQKKYSIVKVYNFTVDTYHTYIADGIWVHNDKGDGAARMDFPDVALYKSVTTDANGKATISFKLPDSITSWRVTAEVVSTDLYGGFNAKNINVTLPFFATTNFAKQLLVGDAPLVTVRGFGKGVASGDAMQGLVQSPFLPQGGAKISGKVFDAVRVNLPSIPVGEYFVTTSVSAKQFKDTLVQKISVVPTLTTRTVAVPVTAQNIPGGKIGLTKFVITDSGRGRYYPDVVTLDCGCGDRVDQKVGRIAASDILRTYFGQNDEDETFTLTDFQDQTGGIKLLPYASVDEELSAKMAALVPQAFDSERLAQYFYTFLSDAKQTDREEVVLAVSGLSSLHEPVLPSVRSLSLLTDLTPKEKMYVALSFAKLGDSESARKIYRELLGQFGENVNPESIKVKIGEHADDIVENTALMAALGSMVHEKGADMLYNYAVQAQKVDILINVEELLFLQNYIPSLPASQGEVTVSVAGKDQIVKVSDGRSKEVWSAPASLPTVKFSNIKGPVQILSVYDVPLTEASVKPTPELTIERKYFVDGKEVQVIHEGDVVEVRIYAKIGQNAVAGDYEVTDVLPAGLSTITSPYRYESYQKCTTQYPLEINGQIVKFAMYKSSNYYCRGTGYFSYDARVNSLGTFKTDTIILQSLSNPDYLNYSGAGKTLTIEQ